MPKPKWDLLIKTFCCLSEWHLYGIYYWSLIVINVPNFLVMVLLYSVDKKIFIYLFIWKPISFLMKCMFTWKKNLCFADCLFTGIWNLIQIFITCTSINFGVNNSHSSRHDPAKCRVQQTMKFLYEYLKFITALKHSSFIHVH